MKKLFKIMFFIFLINSLTSYSQEIEKDSLKEKEPVYLMIEVNPEFSGGTQKLYKFIESNLNLPNKTEYIGKSIMLQFIVEKDGFLTDIKVIRGIDNDTDSKMIDIFKKMPKWQPGIQNGRPVRYQSQFRYTIR